MLIKSIFTNSSGILVSRVLGFVRDLMTASILGANIYSDIFFIAFKIPNLFRRIFAEGAFTQAFLPSFTSADKKIRFSSMVFVELLAFILFLSILVTIFSSLVTKVMAIGFDEKTIELAAPLVAINFYYLPLIFIVTFMGAVLQYKNHFATTAYSTALLNLALIGALLISKHYDQYTIVIYLSYGVLVGGILQVLTHLMAMKQYKMLKVFTFKKLDRKYTKNFYQNFFHATIGSSTAQIASFIDTGLASFLASGSISYLYYANRVFQLPLALFAIATSIALFPMIAKAIKNNDNETALRLMRKSFIFLSIILAISTLIGCIFSEEITKLLFERGEFDADDTHKTAIIFIMYMIGLLPFGLAKIFSLWLYSNHQQKQAAKISMIALGFDVFFSLILIVPLQATGLALAATLSGFVLFYLTIKEFGFSNFYKLLKTK